MLGDLRGSDKESKLAKDKGGSWVTVGAGTWNRRRCVSTAGTFTPRSSSRPNVWLPGRFVRAGVNAANRTPPRNKQASKRGWSRLSSGRYTPPVCVMLRQTKHVAHKQVISART